MNTQYHLKQNNLRDIRIHKGYTQKYVAERMGKQCEDRISHWENGEAMPSIENLFKLCEIYNVVPQEIYLFRPVN